MSLEIPITIATVIAVTYGERVPAYVDAIENFVFIGEGTQAEEEDVLQCAYEMVIECTDQLEQEEIYEALYNNTTGKNKCVEFKDGNVSVHWETRL